MESAETTYRLTSGGFVNPSGEESRFLLLPSSEISSDWQTKQASSIGEYLQVTDKPGSESTALGYRLFGLYAAGMAARFPGARILDVGCGVGSNPPPYAETLLGATPRTATYVGLDPIPHNVEARSFPFICGRIEDLPARLRDSFDLFLFSTTLDHFEDPGAVAAAVRRLAAPGAIAVFWVGLHDTHLVAAEIGAGLFARLFRRVSLAEFALEYLKLPVRAVRAYFYLLRRQKRLEAGEPLDDVHFHYFTESSVVGALERFGSLRDSLTIPGTNWIFAAVAIDAAG